VPLNLLLDSVPYTAQTLVIGALLELLDYLWCCHISVLAAVLASSELIAPLEVNEVSKMAKICAIVFVDHLLFLVRAQSSMDLAVG